MFYSFYIQTIMLMHSTNSHLHYAVVPFVTTFIITVPIVISQDFKSHL